MKLSTKGRYGLRMLIDLGQQDSSLRVTLASIAQRQDVSAHYLEQVASDLKRAGYIISTKGSKGGYMLARKPKDVVVGELLRLLEGDVRLSDIKSDDENILQKCIREAVYDVINDRITDLVDSITLKELIDEHHLKK